MKDLSGFEHAWPGGYFEGDPTDPLAPSSNLANGYVSVPYTTYITCIRPYVTANSVVLELEG